MTFTHKLARRLAILRALPPHCAMVPALALIVACSAGVPTGVDTGTANENAPLVVNPRSLILEANQVSVFKAYASGVPGDSLVTSIEWTATGGAIGLDGTYSSPSIGNYKVVGKRHGPNRTTSDTATVTVVPPQPTVASVIVSPQPATVTARTQQTFSAVGKFSDGSTVAIGVTWTATGGSIDAGGLYTAGSTAGSYQVIAKAASANVADTVPVTVTNPVSVTPGPATPNMPSGFSIPSGYDRNFNAIVEGAFQLAGGLTIRDASTYRPSGVTAPVNPPGSGPYIGESVFPAGYAGGSAPTTAYVPAATMATLGWTQLYTSVYVQLSSNWQGHSSSVNKVLIGQIHSAPCLVLSASGTGSGPLTWQFRLQNLSVDPKGGARNLNPNLGDGTAIRGLWQRVEVLAIANTPGVANGVVRLWVTNYNSNGGVVSGPTKVAEYADIGWSASGEGATWQNMQWQDIWGGTGDVVQNTMYEWVDKMVIAGR